MIDQILEYNKQFVEKKTYETGKKVWNMDYSSTAYGI